jgi:hypothetical protein
MRSIHLMRAYDSLLENDCRDRLDIMFETCHIYALLSSFADTEVASLRLCVLTLCGDTERLLQQTL